MSVRRVLVISHLYIDPARRGKLRALAARDLDVTVGIPQRWIEPGLGRLIETSWERQGSVEIFPIPAARHHDGTGLKFGRRELRSLLRDKRPDLVQIEEDPISPAAAQVGAVARRAQIPAIVFTAENVERPIPWLARRRRRRLLQRSRGVIAGSAAAADLVRRVRADLPVSVIPQLGVSVPLTPEHAYHEGLAIGYVGRLLPEKGIDTLLLALAANRGERWNLTIVGEGPDRERLEQLASQTRLASRTRWVGALPPDQLTSLWPTLDVLVQPSRNVPGWSEPTGQVLMEAMSHEVAVVGTDAGVTSEIIGDAGVVVPADDPPALAAALRRMAAESERKPLMHAGRARVLERFSDVAVAERTAAFWREVIG